MHCESTEQHDSPGGLEGLLADARIWRGRQTRAPGLTALSTGRAELDAVLPGGGWPTGALTELLVERQGIGEFSLLLPAIARLTDAGGENAWVALVAPPYLPYAPALAAAGVALERLLVVRVPADGNDGVREEEALWAAEQTLRSGLCAAVVGWFRQIDDRGLRRLQLAAEEGRAFGVAYRPWAQRSHTSPAALRLALHPGPDTPAPGAQPAEVPPGGITSAVRATGVTAVAGDASTSVARSPREMLVEILKCRGGRPARVHCPLAT